MTTEAPPMLGFDLSEGQQMMAQMISDFGEKHIRPNIMKWDESQEFPVELFHKMGKLGLMGVLVPTEYGGAGLSYREYVTVISEISAIFPTATCGLAGWICKRLQSLEFTLTLARKLSNWVLF